MTQIVAEMDAATARELTDRVKDDAHALWAKLLHLYDGKAWKALGHKSWGAYYTVEFGGSATRGYQLLNAARVMAELHPPTDANGEWLQHTAGLETPLNQKALADRHAGSPQIVDWEPPSNEGVAREFVVLQGQADAVREAWQETIAEHGPEPTAKQTREVVRKRAQPEPESDPPAPPPEPWATRASSSG